MFRPKFWSSSGLYVTQKVRITFCNCSFAPSGRQ